MISKKEIRSKAIKFEYKKDGTVVGRAYLYLIQNELHNEIYGLMEDVFVEESSRGKGLGTELVNAVVAEAKTQKCYKLIATSRFENTTVHELYKKLGFKEHGKEFRMEF